jgi:tRNA 2-selenouridine synthase
MNTINPEQMTDDYTMIDVRSPLEYEDHHIPGAVNVPLLENTERHEVGYLYKQVSVEKAYEKGLEFIAGKMDRFIAKLLPYKNRKLLIYCARGGMRSGSVTRLLESLDFNATQLEGGMKSYRNYVLKQIEEFDYPELIVIQGYTGSAKTKYIEHLEN